jgi:Transposase IS116/IS110/IS902 family
MRLAGDYERLPPMAREALGYIVAQIHDIESTLKIFEQRILSLAKEDEVCRRLMTVQSIGPYIATAIAATVEGPCNFASGRHFAAWLGPTRNSILLAESKAWRNKQARRQLCPSVTRSRRPGDCGSRAERSDEKRLALRASEPAAFQRRSPPSPWQTRQLESHGRSCRQSKPIEGPPDSSASIGSGCARANGRMMAKRSDRNWLIPLALSGSKARQDNWAPVRVSHQGRQRSCAKDRIDSCSRALAKLPKKPLHRGDRR